MTPIDELPALLADAMARAAMPGLALGVVRKGLITVTPLGLTGHDDAQPVTEFTVFDVASLSKPVAALIALRLAAQGTLDLDMPLSLLVTQGVSPVVAAAPITARHLLTHTSGLPNLRGPQPLAVHFAPGRWFSYSSVGFSYLQLAMETAAGEPLEALARRLVFEPLRMQRSSFRWQPAFEADHALPHEDGKTCPKHRPDPQASYSLQTTARDYARFLAGVLEGALLPPALAGQWLSPQVLVPQGRVIHLESTPPLTDPRLAWGLGWGIETADGSFFQWGKMDGVRAFTLGSVREQAALVLLTHSNRGLRLMDLVAQAVLPGDHPAISWLRDSVTE